MKTTLMRESGRRDRYSMVGWTDEVMAVAEHAGMAPEPIVVGHSMGGFVTIVTAASALKTGDLAAAEALIEFLLSESAQRFYAEETQEYPLASVVADDPALQPPGPIDTGAFDSSGGGLERTLELIREAGFDV